MGVGLMRKAFMFPRAWSSRFRPHNFHGTREGGMAGGEINLWASRGKIILLGRFGDVVQRIHRRPSGRSGGNRSGGISSRLHVRRIWVPHKKNGGTVSEFCLG